MKNKVGSCRDLQLHTTVTVYLPILISYWLHLHTNNAYFKHLHTISSKNRSSSDQASIVKHSSSCCVSFSPTHSRSSNWAEKTRGCLSRVIYIMHIYLKGCFRKNQLTQGFVVLISFRFLNWLKWQKSFLGDNVTASQDTDAALGTVCNTLSSSSSSKASV